MSWTVEYDDELQIAVVTYVGKSGGRDFRAAAKERIALAGEKGSTRTLVDASNLEIYQTTTFDVYDIVANTYQNFGNRKDWKIAITLPISPRAREQVHFYETVCVNRGWKVKKFAERTKAIEWLLEDR